ncbi:hypothetical protein STPYR_10567 [uncultured Stenotrophomonas sp.]|uniref:Uncharacterized protein n=1 Tax=uncultured Stenotrophomonas sp. TaxID=165438 RepID=A0A1Y5Q7A6_9GAMM|nr:hypothetical protein STPYR_10567 [uncultured Stenotrophomonas sp.]
MCHLRCPAQQVHAQHHFSDLPVHLSLAYARATEMDYHSNKKPPMPARDAQAEPCAHHMAKNEEEPKHQTSFQRIRRRGANALAFYPPPKNPEYRNNKSQPLPYSFSALLGQQQPPFYKAQTNKLSKTSPLSPPSTQAPGLY